MQTFCMGNLCTSTTAQQHFSSGFPRPAPCPFPSAKVQAAFGIMKSEYMTPRESNGVTTSLSLMNFCTCPAPVFAAPFFLAAEAARLRAGEDALGVLLGLPRPGPGERPRARAPLAAARGASVLGGGILDLRSVKRLRNVKSSLRRGKQSLQSQ